MSPGICSEITSGSKPHEMNPATDYGNVYQEMTSRAPHEQYVYGADTRPSGTFCMMHLKTIHNMLQLGLLHVPRNVGLHILISHFIIWGISKSHGPQRSRGQPK